jgi:hypothetical protein
MRRLTLYLMMTTTSHPLTFDLIAGMKAVAETKTCLT